MKNVETSQKSAEHILYDTHRAGFMNLYCNKVLLHEIKYEW